MYNRSDERRGGVKVKENSVVLDLEFLILLFFIFSFFSVLGSQAYSFRRSGH